MTAAFHKGVYADQSLSKRFLIAGDIKFWAIFNYAKKQVHRAGESQGRQSFFNKSKTSMVLFAIFSPNEYLGLILKRIIAKIFHL
jgi:hypothetical protein